MMDAQIDPAFVALTEKISRDRGFGCASYKEKCLRRRIAVRMRARNVHTYDAYARLLDDDGHEYDLLLDALTINVTKFFRNWEAYSAIEQTVIPDLWDRRGEEIHVWSAGCATGEEPYSLAMLFHRHAKRRGEIRRLCRVRIVATDIDRGCLATATVAQYGEGALADTPDELRREYFREGPPFRVPDEVRALVHFERRDLLRDGGERDLHLVVCRNVIIYFDRESQERLFARFRDALAPGGFLVLGKVETLLGAARTAFQPIEPRERVFRRS